MKVYTPEEARIIANKTISFGYKVVDVDHFHAGTVVDLKLGDKHVVVMLWHDHETVSANFSAEQVTDDDMYSTLESLKNKFQTEEGLLAYLENFAKQPELFT